MSKICLRDRPDPLPEKRVWNEVLEYNIIARRIVLNKGDEKYLYGCFKVGNNGENTIKGE